MVKLKRVRRVAGVVTLIGCSAVTVREEPRIGRIELSSDYQPLVDGFAWARGQALAYVFDGDPVGHWYEAALPRREAFCMRDVSHQARGALALGLAEHTRNMMYRFAVNVAESRRWCSFWEINRYDQPAPVDYRSDEDFWYNLPANFDVIQSIHGIYEWTGDETYLADSVFRNFYRRSLTDYVAAWDDDGDGIMESPAANGYRGIPTYWEGDGPRALTGSDLIASQFAANEAFAAILGLTGNADEAEPYSEAAVRLKRWFNDEWWNPDLGRFYTSIVEGGSFDTTLIPLLQIMPLYFGIVEPGPNRERLIDDLPEESLVEVNVYLPEVYYDNGRADVAFRYLMRQMNPDLPRREYPENSFTAIGTIVHHLAGISPLASESLVETLPRLTGDVGWVQLDHVPVLANEISVKHDGVVRTRLGNESGGDLRWRAVLPGAHTELLLEGRPTPARLRQTENGAPESFLTVEVPRGAARAVSVPGGRLR